MDINHLGGRPLGLAAAATLALGLVAIAPAANAARGPVADGRHASSASVTNGTLTLIGTRHADHVTLTPAADLSRLLVDLGDGAGPRSFDRGSFTNIAAFLGAGDDTLVAGAAVANPMTVDGGAGDDTITGGAAADQLAGGRGDDTIQGGDGDDLILGGRGDDTVDGQRGTDTEILGSGNDHAGWLPGEGSDNVDGGSGTDTLVFDGANGNEKFALSASGPHAILTRDVGGIRMDTSDVDALDLAALGGTDSVTVGDLSGTALDHADIDLGASRNGGSDGQLDTIELDGSDRGDRVAVRADGPAVEVHGLHTSVRVIGSDSRDQLQLNTGNGRDAVSVSRAAQALILVAVDLGAGQY